LKDVNIQTKSKMTPLHFLVKYNVYEMENKEAIIPLNEEPQEKEEEEYTRELVSKKQSNSNKNDFKEVKKYSLNQVSFQLIIIEISLKN
jgi:hypothetical protein